MADKTGKSNSWILLAAMACVLFLTGLSIILYPLLTNWLYTRDVQFQKRDFEQQIETAQERLAEVDSPALPFEELYLEMKRRNEELYLDHQKDLKDPFSYDQPGIDLTEYGLEGNTVGFLSIPKMDIELPILLGASPENLQEGAAHLTETSYPIGGENTNCVIAAHRGYDKARLFRDIEDLALGDEIFIKNYWGKLTYQVAEIRIISPTDVQDLLIQAGRDLVTLITCHPYRYNYQRYVVYCERVADE